MTDLSSVLAPAPRRVLAEDVAERLREAILRGYFAPGQRLREEGLAATLDVSRGTVREALTELERQGLVIIRRHRGATVARLSRSDVEEVYSLRLALEQLAVQQAARKASPEDLAAMEAVLNEMVEAFPRGVSPREVADLDVRFHDLLYRAAKHERLSDCWSNLRSQIYVFLLTRNAANPDFRELTVTMHATILDALRAHDEQTAVQVIAEHLHGSYLRVLKVYTDKELDLGAAPQRV